MRGVGSPTAHGEAHSARALSQRFLRSPGPGRSCGQEAPLGILPPGCGAARVAEAEENS